jgi:glucose-1-phosphate adenylyltransferase
MRMGDHWYQGTADSIYQNLNLIRDAQTDHVAVFGGDHIYKFDISKMEQKHIDTEADLTVAAFPVPRSEAHQFGVIEIDASNNILKFWEKPTDPVPLPNDPNTCLVSMGNYFFRSNLLQELLIADAANSNSTHDFGRDIIPQMVQDGFKVKVYNFGDNYIEGEIPDSGHYWRDVGTLESYFAANMETRGPLPPFNLYNRKWRIRTAQRDYPPARFVQDQGGVAVIDSLVCEGSIISSAELRRVVLGYDCFVHSGSQIEDAVILSGCNIGSKARLKYVLLDKNCSIEKGAVIGEDPIIDRQRFPFITESGMIVLPKGTYVPQNGPIELAYDVDFFLRQDPAAQHFLEKFAGEYTVSERERHSYESAGPRYRRFYA